MTDRVAALEARLQRLEDERDITQLIAAYGPLVDAGDAEAVSDLWETDGIYDIDEVYMEGRDQLTAMVNSSGHQQFIKDGCAHFLGPAKVTVSGDSAIAVCHSLMVVRQDGQFVVRRATAHHWELRRSGAGWRTTTRTSRVLDGRLESPELLRRGAHGLPHP
ncbi:MAG TPA: nuclear transport factor 2 family protein [Marmoricola sp.]|nr:nuclear transport factor 2 family protein [Marmoricola sp.]